MDDITLHTTPVDPSPSDSTASASMIGADYVQAFVRDVLLSTDRVLPVVALTTWNDRRGFPVDPDPIARDLHGHAVVVGFVTGKDTILLTEALNPKLTVHSGAMRVWWPGLAPDSNPLDHPLLFVNTRTKGLEVAQRIVAAILHGEDLARRPLRTETTPTHPDGATSTPSAPPRRSAASGATKTGRPIIDATVVRVDGPQIYVEAAGVRGAVLSADEGLSSLAARLDVGTTLPVFAVNPANDGTPGFSTQGLLDRTRAPQHAPAAPAPRASSQTTTGSGKPLLTATVVGVEGSTIRVSVAGQEGVVAYCDEGRTELASRLHAGQTLTVFKTPPLLDGTPTFSTQGQTTPTSATKPAKPKSTAIARTPPQGPIHVAEVIAVEGTEVHVSAPPGDGIVIDADVPLQRLAAEVTPGDRLRVRHEGGAREGQEAYSMRGVLPDAWSRMADVYAMGQIVPARVCHIEQAYVLVEVLPGAALFVPREELDWHTRARPDQLFRIGERVNAKILSLDPGRRRGVASIKQGYFGSPRPAMSLGPGYPPFLSGDSQTAMPTPADTGARRESPNAQILAENAALREQIRAARRQLTELQRELRSTRDQLSAMEARYEGDADPTRSATAFLVAVRVEYARRWDESDRTRYPLQSMRVGRQFLDSLQALDGLPVDKVVDVCAQVASLRAHEVPGRQVHPLKSGAPGAPPRTRERDGAKAWRCALQDNTAAARRLHWWDIPGTSGRTIEFASVGTHDDLDIPE